MYRILQQNPAENEQQKPEEEKKADSKNIIKKETNNYIYLYQQATIKLSKRMLYAQKLCNVGYKDGLKRPISSKAYNIVKRIGEWQMWDMNV